MVMQIGIGVPRCFFVVASCSALFSIGVDTALIGFDVSINSMHSSSVNS